MELNSYKIDLGDVSACQSATPRTNKSGGDIYPLHSVEITLRARGGTLEARTTVFVEN
jgi:hypothetical protein